MRNEGLAGLGGLSPLLREKPVNLEAVLQVETKGRKCGEKIQVQSSRFMINLGPRPLITPQPLF